MATGLKVGGTLLLLLILAGGVYWYRLTHVRVVERVAPIFLDEADVNTDLVASTEAGRVLGFRHEKGVTRFSRIPFAAAPMGELRFQPPQPVTPWAGVLDTREIGPSCLQKTIPWVSDESAFYQSEDCLYLVVSTPKLDRKKRPVIVWIHGGGLWMGSASERVYDGANFSSRGDIVFVGLQYRLGGVGWLDVAHLGGEDSERSALNGQLDVLAGLEWIQRNIEQFGGDPDNVTIMGESAGSYLVASLLVHSEAGSLFDKAILQSGVFDRLEAPLDRRGFAQQMMEEMGVNTLTGLRQLDSEAMRGFEEKAFEMAQSMGLADPMLWYQPSDVTADGIEAAAANGKPVLHGTLENEYHMFLALYEDADDSYQALTDALFGQLGLSAEQVDSLIEQARPSLPDRTDRDIRVDLLSAVLMHYPHSIVSERYGAEAPAYAYLIDWVSPEFPEWGAFHALDLPFVFGTLDTWSWAVGDDPPQGLSDDLQDAWIAFARSGDPSHEGIPAWPAYDRQTRSTMRFGDTTELVSDPLGWVRLIGLSIDGMIKEGSRVDPR